MIFSLTSEDFSLSLEPQHFEDAPWGMDAVIKIAVRSEDFFISTAMTAGWEDFIGFAMDLCAIYETLTGTATIREQYGHNMQLSFTADGKGHISFTGYMYKESSGGNVYSADINACIDQTSLQDFCYELKDFAKNKG